ncbi:CmcJ/NvfI family oxidoreductase [Novosphingobium mathurense]|uniref:CmcJ/NvfI family oxidoreductase n=1 Tax=Novosphingobium mathurense TaxID=428990 RepID=UPI001116F16E|nr:CmcJ/NvfI family oxidoreductase [Novosphingobium mathurense]
MSTFPAEQPKPSPDAPPPADYQVPHAQRSLQHLERSHPSPEDVTLALCKARTVSPDDLLPSEAIYDRDGKDLWSFEGPVPAHSSRHRWCWFSDMTPGAALVFKTYDSAPDVARCVPHVAFDNPDANHHAVPRASIEQRAIAYWF